jgi:hypothetical protein
MPGYDRAMLAPSLALRRALRLGTVLLFMVGAALVPAAAGAAGTWNAESYLASPLREATGPSIAVTTNGAAVAGWQANQGEFGSVDVFLTSRASGTAPFATGGTQQHVDSAKAHGEGDMGVVTAVNPSGKAVVAWVQATYTGNFRVQAVVRAAGASTFGPVQTLTAEGEDAAVPAVAMNAAGATVLVWRRHETATESWQVQGAALSDADTTFSTLNGGGNISDEPDDNSDFFVSPVRVAIAPSGAAVVTWDSTDVSHLQDARWARRAPGEAAFAAPHSLGAVTMAPDVAAGDGGGFALTWVTGSGGTGATVSLARASTGDFGAATPVASTPGAFVDTRAGVDAAGNAIVAVLGTTEATFGAKRRVAVTTCATTCPVPSWLSADGQDANGIALAVNAAGDAVLAWSRSNGTRELIEASLLAHGSNWDPPVFVSGSGQAAHAPTVGIDGGGNVTAAWTAANVALFAVRQAVGAVAGATAPPDGPGTGGGGEGGGGGGGGQGGTGQPGGSPPAAAPVPAPVPAPTPTPAADRSLAASAKQSATLTAAATGTFSGPKITCSEPTDSSCKAIISFKTTTAKAKSLTVAHLTLTIAGGKTATPKLKLTKAAKKLLGAKRKLTLKGSVVITDAAGNTRTFTINTTLKAAVKKQRR